MKKTVIFTTLILILAALLPILPTAEDAQIYERTLRLHVIANSDSKADQEVKLLVRDAVLELLKDDLEQAQSREDAAAMAEANREAILSCARRILTEQGYEGEVSLQLCEEYYPRKEYGEVCLPAGRYLSLQIKLGESKGQNWWCVLFPTLCTSSAKPREELVDAGFTLGQIRLITDSDSPRYKIKFRLLELFNK